MKQILAILLCLTLAGGMAMTAHADESTLDFFKGLNFDDGLSVQPNKVIPPIRRTGGVLYDNICL